MLSEESGVGVGVELGVVVGDGACDAAGADPVDCVDVTVGVCADVPEVAVLGVWAV